MGVNIEDNKLVIKAGLKNVHFDLSKNVDNDFKHETD